MAGIQVVLDLAGHIDTEPARVADCGGGQVKHQLVADQTL